LKYGTANRWTDDGKKKVIYIPAETRTLLDLKSVEEAMRKDGTLPWIGASKAILERAVEGHILARGELVGRYKEE